ncbi:Arginine metabolism regulation protein II [Lachnellula hyalina]|uniref:Arginine metabolism regulation protein II n=1 Tax=Lachnellula hyalina TaxID=1316788 RepID=A0A8H8QSZ7_9HELO|nr:Arginine metabolism regulation protein II [Lachnellula hyalina]TVY22243.1 Arginine metabolism regulation protein II [Lachnellula hyalina]
MARSPRIRPKVKRTKTFTGCWTCRSRRVKCDATRPVCQRCIKSKLCCAGYRIRLVWGQDAICTEGVQPSTLDGRILFSKEDMSNPTFSDDYINSILDRLEYFEEYAQVGLGNEIKLGPFTVFTGSSVLSTSTRSSDCGDVEDDEVITTFSEGISASTPEEKNILEPMPSTQTMCRYKDQPTPTLMLQQRLLPFLKPFLSSSSVTERRLLHFWVTSASSIMTCTDHPDNPFRQVVIPIALEAAASSHKLPGHAALLHIIYAFAGFHLAQLDQSDQNSKEIATNHYHASLRHLCKSLTDQNPHKQYDAILAVIILVISIDTLNGQSGQWQIHMRGAREWLREVGDVWSNHAYGHVMYQMFECLEIMGHTQTPHIQLPSNLTHKQKPNIDKLFSATSDVSDNPYCLDKFFGVTKPVLKMIMDINRLLGSEPTREELAIIEHEILLANPSTTRFPGPKDIEQITRSHACALYYSANTKLSLVSSGQSASRHVKQKIESFVFDV